MIELNREMDSSSIEEGESQNIQWQWLPLLFAYLAIWFYGLWCLVSKIV